NSQTPGQIRSLPQELRALPLRWTRDQHQTLRLRVCAVDGLRRRHRRLPPLPRTIQNSALSSRFENRQLLLVRSKPEPRPHKRRDVHLLRPHRQRRLMSPPIERTDAAHAQSLPREAKNPSPQKPSAVPHPVDHPTLNPPKNSRKFLNSFSDLRSSAAQ